MRQRTNLITRIEVRQRELRHMIALSYCFEARKIEWMWRGLRRLDRLKTIMSKPRLLDLYCGAGGCTKGYQQAGFWVRGVDVKPQPRYVGEQFIQADALEYLRGLIGSGEIAEFDAVHASPPCQAHTALKSMWNAKEHADLVAPTRELLKASGLPYVMENVPGSPLGFAIELCGTMFGLGSGDAELRRHRLFECSFFALAPHCRHGERLRVIGVYGGHGRDRRRKANTQNFSTEARREAMGIPWMDGYALSQAIPPAYTEFIGSQLIVVIKQ